MEAFPYFFPLFFIFFWLFITTMLGVLSGWYTLMKKFPDKPEKPLLQLNYQSGMLGITSMSGVLKIAVCPSGLRLGIVRIFGVFSRDFFVPWQEIQVIRINRFLWKSVTLQFGKFGALKIQVQLANKLAHSAQERWPEPGPFPTESHWHVFVDLAKYWGFYTTIGALFFIFGPRIAMPEGTPQSASPPISVAILFPAICIGILCFIEYFKRIKR